LEYHQPETGEENELNSFTVPLRNSLNSKQKLFFPLKNPVLPSLKNKLGHIR